jgi:hypothetical protein
LFLLDKNITKVKLSVLKFFGWPLQRQKSKSMAKHYGFAMHNVCNAWRRARER